ncbi:DUF6328 family protein [Streptomyces noursei]|uniref:DUF6328 family protein n=1 Tax=Streptomyces TaxID=1883 RepID=UPI0035DC124F
MDLWRAATPGKERTESGSDEAKREGTGEKADCEWNEVLREVRVTQTGAQILLGFLIGIVFTPRYTQISPADRTLYQVTVVLGALATGTPIAPVAFHRFLVGHQMMPELAVREPSRSRSGSSCLG